METITTDPMIMAVRMDGVIGLVEEWSSAFWPNVEAADVALGCATEVALGCAAVKVVTELLAEAVWQLMLNEPTMKLPVKQALRLAAVASLLQKESV